MNPETIQALVVAALNATACGAADTAMKTKKGGQFIEATHDSLELFTLADLVEARGVGALPRPEVKELTNENVIKMFLHCRRCLDCKPDSESPESWARLSVGFTREGLQVWCVRHDINVSHIHFEGFKHPANSTAKKRKDGVLVMEKGIGKTKAAGRRKEQQP